MALTQVQPKQGSPFHGKAGHRTLGLDAESAQLQAHTELILASMRRMRHACMYLP